MAIEVFNRYEKKYLLNSDTFISLSGRLADYMELDGYNKRFETYPITNLYYDTADSHLIRTSLSKPKYKEKLRLRAYGVPVWLCRLLSEYRAYPASFSKYGKEYIQMIESGVPRKVYSFMPAKRALPLKTAINA